MPQVSVQCAERGSLLADIWVGYSSLVESVNATLRVSAPHSTWNPALLIQARITCVSTTASGAQRVIRNLASQLKEAWICSM